MSIMKFSELEKLGMPLLVKGTIELGFKKLKGYKYGFYKKMTENAEYIIGFSTGKPFPGHCMINPSIGAAQNGITSLFKEISGFRGKSSEATVGRSLGYYTPKNTYITWDLGLGDVKTITDDLLDTLRTYGIPAMEKMLDLRYFAEEYRQHGFLARHYLPVIYYKLGEYDKCLEYMKESLELLTTKPFLFRIPIDYHQFYDKMVALIESAGSESAR